MMHPIIRDQLEQVLAGAGSPAAGKHLAECEECRDALAGMQQQSAMLRQWRAAEAETMEPRAGFYARVLERIEAQRPLSVFTVFFDSLFARRIAMASLALALLLGVYVISSEEMAEPQIAASLPQATLVSDHVSDMPQSFPVLDESVSSSSARPRLVTSAPDQDAVLVNLVTYREQ